MPATSATDPLAAEDPPTPHPLFAWPCFERVRDAARSTSLRALLRGEAHELDAAGVAAAFGWRDDPIRTCLRAVRRATCTAPSILAQPQSLEPALLSTVARGLARHPGAAIALSGGVDSALLVAAARQAGLHPPLLTLATPFPDYDESARARAVARSFGRALVEVHVEAADFVDALQGAVVAAEAPFFNMHPVGRFLLGRAAARMGYPALMTGDGADQVFAGASGSLWLPIARALTEGGGVAAITPFLEPEVMAVGAATQADGDKRRLRELAVRLGVPAVVGESAKIPRLVPPIDVSGFIDRKAIERLAASVAMKVQLDDPRQQVSWASLLLLWQAVRRG